LIKTNQGKYNNARPVADRAQARADAVHLGNRALDGTQVSCAGEYLSALEKGQQGVAGIRQGRGVSPGGQSGSNLSLRRYSG
jgi:hypothetical protein